MANSLQSIMRHIKLATQADAFTSAESRAAGIHIKLEWFDYVYKVQETKELEAALRLPTPAERQAAALARPLTAQELLYAWKNGCPFGFV